jgi:beta-glucosidase
MLPWQIAAIVADVILAAGFIALEVRIINAYKKKRES